MTEVETATCQDCGWQGPVEETKEFRNVWDRVLPGDVMPAGECPEEGCSGAAMPDADRHGADDLRPQMVALMLGLDRLRDDLRKGALRSPIAFHLKELADYARRALASGPACSARLQCLRRRERPGGRQGVLERRRSVLGVALHLRGGRRLRGLRPRVQLHDEARHGGGVMQERSAFDFGGNRIVRQSEPMKIGNHRVMS